MQDETDERPRRQWARLALVVAGLGLCGAFVAHLQPTPAPLPRIRLPDGGEFRVIEVIYTKGPSESYEHAIRAAPKVVVRAWEHLPKWLKARVPYPTRGIGGGGSDHPLVTIWWAYIDPHTKNPELGATDYANISLDAGAKLQPIWPRPCDEGYRQIFIVDPPTTSKHFHVRIAAEYQPVEFEIENPAYVP